MGWLFCESNKPDLVKRVTFNYRDVLLDQALVGNTLYLLVKADDYDTILVFLLAAGRSFNNIPANKWGYKDMSESMGPAVKTCPKRLLDKSTCPDKWAVEWREACHALHAQKAAENKRAKAMTDGTYRFTIPETASDEEKNWFETYGGSPTHPTFELFKDHWYAKVYTKIRASKKWALQYNPEKLT